MHNCINRFLRYVKVDTRSSESSDTSPSTENQHQLAAILEAELKALGLINVYYDKEHCYVYGTLPGNHPHPFQQGLRPYVIGFIAHMDTSPDVTGTNVQPRIVEQYDGGDIVLHPENQVVLSPKEFPALQKQIGNDLVVTTGDTLLGADDKAGIAEIMTMLEILVQHPEMIHGDIQVCFTPDEEVGAGTKYFDLERFGADGAYTVDGGALGELEYENFNAAEAMITVYGRNVHPGTAKGQMKNATLMAYEFQSMLPVFSNPMYTEKREGFIHLNQMRGTVEKAVMHYILRDHDAEKLEAQKTIMRQAAAFLNQKYGAKTVEVIIEDVYRNMIEKIKSNMHLVEIARAAMEAEGVQPIEAPIRGGTDGAWLSWKGLPCPNLCTGGYNYHSRFEYASVQEMEQTVNILVGIATRYGTVAVRQDGETVLL